MDFFSKIIAGFMAFITAFIALFTGGNGGNGETTTVPPAETTTITAEPTTLSPYLNGLKTKGEANKVTYASYINGLISATNAYRKEKGLAELTVDDDLVICACARAQEIADSGEYSHTRPDGSDPSTLIKQMNYKYYGDAKAVGENLANGFNNGDGAKDSINVVNAWKASAAHNENLLRPVFTRVGAGVAVAQNGTTYWVMYFHE